jgi:hypothetical protein
MADLTVCILEFVLQETWRFSPKIRHLLPSLAELSLPLPLEPDSCAPTIKLLASYIINMKPSLWNSWQVRQEQRKTRCIVVQMSLCCTVYDGHNNWFLVYKRTIRSDHFQLSLNNESLNTGTYRFVGDIFQPAVVIKIPHSLLWE